MYAIRSYYAPLLPEAEVIADNEVFYPQAVDQQFLDEFLGLQMGEVGIEAADAGQTDTLLSEHFELFTQGR